MLFIYRFLDGLHAMWITKKGKKKSLIFILKDKVQFLQASKSPYSHKTTMQTMTDSSKFGNFNRF